MRRARVREMEGQCNALPNKFFTKVMEIPVVKFGVGHAAGIYGKVKDFNVITHKSFELAETVTGAVVGRVTPFAQKGMCIAKDPLEKIDNFAAQGLQTLEDKVPVINKEPQVMVSDVKGAVTEKFLATKERVTKASEGVLVSRPIQTYFDLMQFILSTGEKTLNKILPPEQSEDSNGDVPSDSSPENKAERGWWLLSQFFGLLGTAKNRITRRVINRLETTSSAVDTVFKETKKAVNHALPIVEDKKEEQPTAASVELSMTMKTTETTNGDSKKGKKNKHHQNKGSSSSASNTTSSTTNGESY